MRVRVRTAEPSDGPQIRDTLRDAFAEHVSTLGATPSPLVRSYEALIERRFVFVAEGGMGLDDPSENGPGPLAGVAVTRPRSAHLYLDALAVRPEWRRRGLGAALLDAAEALAAALCYDHLRLHTPPALHTPLKFYRALGYREINRDGVGAEARALLEKPVPNALAALLDVR